MTSPILPPPRIRITNSIQKPKPKIYPDITNKCLRETKVEGKTDQVCQ